jgi:hypothetical protein
LLAQDEDRLLPVTSLFELPLAVRQELLLFDPEELGLNFQRQVPQK